MPSSIIPERQIGEGSHFKTRSVQTNRSSIPCLVLATSRSRQSKQAWEASRSVWRIGWTPRNVAEWHAVDRPGLDDRTSGHRIDRCSPWTSAAGRWRHWDNVLSSKGDRLSLGFVWRKPASSSPPEDFEMTVQVFGAVCSPTTCTFTLGQTAEDNKEEFEDIAAELVDNFLDSFECEEEAITTSKRLIELLTRGALRLNQCLSSSRTVFRPLPSSEWSSPEYDIDLEPVERTLGQYWNCKEEDSFCFQFKVVQVAGTERQILAAATMLAPVVLVPKISLQDIWRVDVDWHESVPADLLLRWRHWAGDVTSLLDLHIARWPAPSRQIPGTVFELHPTLNDTEAGIARSRLPSSISRGWARCQLNACRFNRHFPVRSYYFATFRITVRRSCEKWCGVPFLRVPIYSCCSPRSRFQYGHRLVPTSLRSVLWSPWSPINCLQRQWRQLCRCRKRATRSRWLPQSNENIRPTVSQRHWMALLSPNRSRLVKSCKAALRATLKNRQVAQEVLRTTFTHVEALLNGRPPTHLSMDPADLEPLTPNHFLPRPNPVLPSDVIADGQTCFRRRWIHAQLIVNQVWKRWLKGVRSSPHRGKKVASPRTRSTSWKTKTDVYTRPAVKLRLLESRQDVSVPVQNRAGNVPVGCANTNKNEPLLHLSTMSYIESTTLALCLRS